MSSRTYWKNREEEQRKKNIKDEAEYAKEIEKIYVNMMDEIQKEINGFYTRYAKAEGITIAEAKKRVSKMDIDAYSRKAKRYVKDKNFSKEANEEMRLYNAAMKINRLEMLKANIGMHLVGGFDELQKYFEQILTEKTLEEFERQAGILGKSIQNNAKMAHSIVNASFHNARYSDRIWMYQDMVKAELSKLLQTGLIQGKNPRTLARHLTKLFGVSRENAERLMITELSRVQAEAQKQSYIRNGFEEYEFIAEPTACPICRALDGKHFKVSKMMPGENAHPMHPRCRCSTAAYMDDKEYDEWLDGYSEHGMDFETWKKRVEKKSTFDIIKADKTVSGHSGTPKMAEVGMVIDHIGKDGKVDARAFYGESKLKYKDIHTTDHGNPKQHPYGNHGEHAHDYTWGEDGRLKDKTTRELSEEERKENGDIL